MNFLEKTINGALDILQSDEVDICHEDNKSPPIEEEKDSEFISNLLGEVNANISHILLLTFGIL